VKITAAVKTSQVQQLPLLAGLQTRHHSVARHCKQGDNEIQHTTPLESLKKTLLCKKSPAAVRDPLLTTVTCPAAGSGGPRQGRRVGAKRGVLCSHLVRLWRNQQSLQAAASRFHFCFTQTRLTV